MIQIAVLKGVIMKIVIVKRYKQKKGRAYA